MASPVLMFMVLCSCYSIAYGGDENGYVVVPTSSFEPDETAVCSNARVIIVIDMLHRLMILIMVLVIRILDIMVKSQCQL
ncbi:unnamed protein product [Miscanthus lutarioriparius]|uniref:Uncharacterized protein n=1 Tax=Miscanthus lutarioriparius TaxID=422564 RepID=A0A811SDW6_9POAL|nr:unnamed protein product [Miscanthus lutarioriparius]